MNWPFIPNNLTNSYSKISSFNNVYTGWNDKIVVLEKTTWIHFRLMKTGFLFLLQIIYWLASCVQIPRAIGAFYRVER